MTLQQLRYLCAVVDCGMNVSRAAETLHVSQPGVSKIIHLLEQELGVDILVRKGNRILALTDQGTEVVAKARRILGDAHDLREMAADQTEGASGVLRIATTHLQARYALVDVVRQFVHRFPAVELRITQAGMDVATALVSEGRVDIGISAVPLRIPANVLAVDAYPIERCVIVPLGHPLLGLRRSTLRDLARHPLVTYDDSNNAGLVVQREFRRHGFTPRISVTATDANVIKAYVAAGLGIAVLQRMALEPNDSSNVCVLPETHVFPSSMTSLIFRRGQYLRGYVFEFIRMVSPGLDRGRLKATLSRDT